MKQTKEQKLLLALDILRKMPSEKIDIVNIFSLGLMASNSNFEETCQYIKEIV
ncbi:hypothetical protein [Bacillus cereus]|uniref:Uncharacterized protein n=1 Tax=Bacillus cereus VD184 TaxID=1053242 RepID=A0A9W5RB84_BACCE|nr:hypothetical protein [Bacillus cereus]EOQ18622.1 hypothetical protein IKC_05123 [Bacillus cereus VD184]